MNAEKSLVERSNKLLHEQAELLKHVYLMLNMPEGIARDLFKVQLKNVIEDHFQQASALSQEIRALTGDTL